jgi:AcrR family transcriptional regulator
MARSKDEKKRQSIMQAAKTLFSRQGFFNTSVTDITKETGLPVGSIYTYFKGKEEIVRAIVSEGWDDLRNRLVETVASARTPEEKLKVIIDIFLPEVLNDLDLVNILLSEAITYTRIEEKVEELSGIILGLLKTIAKDNKSLVGFDKSMMDTALVVYFLGIMAAVKISRSSSIGLKVADILKFIKYTIGASLGVDLK